MTTDTQATAGTGSVAGAPAGPLPADDGPTPSSRRWSLASGPAYLVLSVLLWWQVWTAHPSTVTTCGCGDAARFLWFFEWPAFALAHGHGLF